MAFEPIKFPSQDLRLCLTEGISDFRGTVGRTILDYRHFVLNHLKTKITTTLANINDGSDSFTWPSETSPLIMLKFLHHVGMLGLDSTPETISKYIRTVEQINSNNNNTFFHNVHILFGTRDAAFQLKIIQTNVAFFGMLDGSQLPDTPYASLSRRDIINRTDQLLKNLAGSFDLRKGCIEIVAARTHDTDIRPIVATMFTTSDMLTDRDLKPHQMLLDYLFQIAAEGGLRRTENAVYKQRNNGHDTYYFEWISDTIDWIYRAVTPINIAPEMYDALTLKPSTPKHILDILSKLPDVRFPFLIKTRTLFSYQNGIFDAGTGKFYVYEKNTPDIVSVHEALGCDFATSNYFDVEFPISYMNPAFDFRLIPTPSFDKILDDQDFDTKAVYWMLSLTGRMLHDVNSKDGWQVASYLKGVAGSGKSTWYRLVSRFYEAIDIGYLADDCETRFVDQHLIDSKMVLCLDVSSEFGLSTTRFNSYASGEAIVVNRKFLTAVTKQWTAPIAFAGNSQPPIESRSGSGVRRFVIFVFDNVIKNTDTCLIEKCNLELPFFLIKCAMHYLDAVNEYGTISLWDRDDILPQMCHKARQEYLVTCCSLSAFLSSDVVEYNTVYQTAVHDIEKAYRQYMKDCKQKSPPKLDKTTAQTFLYAHNCEWIENGTEDPRYESGLHNRMGGKKGIIFGLRLSDGFDASDMDAGGYGGINL